MARQNRFSLLLGISSLALAAVAVSFDATPPDGATVCRMQTLHEGARTYVRHWNFWTRTDGEVDRRSERFFREYESLSPAVTRLVRAAGGPGPLRTEREIWQKIGQVWNFLRTSVRHDNEGFSALSSERDAWPSIDDYARYHDRSGRLVWAACFSKAHLFATLLGRVVTPRDRIVVASARHTMAGAPPTATHVYVAVYVADRWFYLDPSYAGNFEFPPFEERRSIGCPTTGVIDYQHPYKLLRLPTSTLERVPYLPD